MKLYNIQHPYYCSQQNYFASPDECPILEYESWQEFFDDAGDDDEDMNHVFRWDWEHAGEYTELKQDELHLFYIGQRKGVFRSVAVKVNKEDEPAIKEWLQKKWAYVKLLWEPFA